MWENIRNASIWFYATFHNNETLVYARTKAMIGAVWIAVSGSDLSAIIENPKWLGYWMIFDAAVTEYLRRIRADFTGSDDKDTK
jgi:hypothetical protein